MRLMHRRHQAKIIASLGPANTIGGDNTAETRPKSINRAYDLLQLLATA